MYKIKEIYYTIQGEGFHTGKAAVFCRFSGCNLWSGREEDRAKAICQFCDTNFWGMDGENGGSYSIAELVNKCNEVWKGGASDKFIVFTGGEPILQLDFELLESFKKAGYYTAVETNGTLPCPENLDWICMSPKANTDIVQSSGNECKVVHPQKGMNPIEFEKMDFDHFYLQPMDNEDQMTNIASCVEFCKSNPKWKLSLQTHKLIGIS